MKHTPGPWKVEKVADFTFVIAADKEIHDKYRDKQAICEVLGKDTPANARLMAAAPDLLEVAKITYRAIVLGNGREIDWQAIADSLSDAIKKAKGEQ